MTTKDTMERAKEQLAIHEQREAAVGRVLDIYTADIASAKEEAELNKKLLEETREVYALSVQTENELRHSEAYLRQQLAETHKLWQESCSDAFEKSKQLAQVREALGKIAKMKTPHKDYGEVMEYASSGGNYDDTFSDGFNLGEASGKNAAAEIAAKALAQGVK